MAEPTKPEAERRERLLAILADFISRGGAAGFLAPPVKPGGAAFPEPWKPTRAGITALLRRLVWHAGGLGDRKVEVTYERLGAPPTEHKPATRLELTEVRPKELAFLATFIGEDDIVGTFAHEVGVAFAALHRPDEADPYRTSEQPIIKIEGDRDLERGSIATVYLGLGVLAANAAFQQFASRTQINAYSNTVFEVHRAGYAELSDLAFLLAVQAVVRGDGVPEGLGGPQRDEVAGWIDALRDRKADLRERLGIPAGAEGEPRQKPTRFIDVDLHDDEPVEAQRKGFRWRTHRGGVGLLVGMLAGGVLVGVAPAVGAVSLLAGGLLGHLAGRRVDVWRCSACASPVPKGTTKCPKCGAALRGDIRSLNERLEAEERLEADRAE